MKLLFKLLTNLALKLNTSIIYGGYSNNKYIANKYKLKYSRDVEKFVSLHVIFKDISFKHIHLNSIQKNLIKNYHLM